MPRFYHINRQEKINNNNNNYVLNCKYFQHFEEQILFKNQELSECLASVRHRDQKIETLENIFFSQQQSVEDKVKKPELCTLFRIYFKLNSSNVARSWYNTDTFTL